MAQLRAGDLVIRNHRLLKTRGTIVRVAPQRRGEARQVWVKWNHSQTLPNPSLEAADDLELVGRPDEPVTGSHRSPSVSASTVESPVTLSPEEDANAPSRAVIDEG